MVCYRMLVSSEFGIQYLSARNKILKHETVSVLFISVVSYFSLLF